jgi:hypothetical protein
MCLIFSGLIVIMSFLPRAQAKMVYDPSSLFVAVDRVVESAGIGQLLALLEQKIDAHDRIPWGWDRLAGMVASVLAPSGTQGKLVVHTCSVYAA